MSWGMFLANLAAVMWTVWFPVEAAVAREASGFLNSGWFCSSWDYRSSEAASAGVPIGLTLTPGNVIINIGESEDTACWGFLFSGFLNFGLFDF